MLCLFADAVEVYRLLKTSCMYLYKSQESSPSAAAALPPPPPGSCAHPHRPRLPPAEAPGLWTRRYLARPDPLVPDSACCCCPPTADPGSFPKASLLPPGPSLGCLMMRRAWHSANRQKTTMSIHKFKFLKKNVKNILIYTN